MTAQSAPVFHVIQKITPFQNAYRIYDDAGGKPGRMMGYAAQKRLAFRESFTVYADEAQTRPVLGVQADRRLDIASVMEVTDLHTGERVGSLRKKAVSSVLRSTWHLEQPGLPPVTVRERSLAVALARRVWELIPVANRFRHPSSTSRGSPSLDRRFCHTCGGGVCATTSSCASSRRASTPASRSRSPSAWTRCSTADLVTPDRAAGAKGTTAGLPSMATAASPSRLFRNSVPLTGITGAATRLYPQSHPAP